MSDPRHALSSVSGTARRLTLIVFCVLACSLGVTAQTFVNPILPHAADPSVIFVDGMYYTVRAGCAHTGSPVICIIASPSLVTLGENQPMIVWSAPAVGPNSHDVWAPEIEHTHGRWYIYYAADPDTNPHHGLFALVPDDNAKPLGRWHEADTGNPAGGFKLDWKSDWAIDPSTFRASDGRLYLLFACRQDNTDQGAGRFQSICIAQMSDPLHLAADPLTGHKVFELSFPTQAWERRGFPTQEGPFGFTHDGVDYILYSASFSGTPDQYAEGVLINRHLSSPVPGENPLLDPADWVKEGPVFDGHHAAYGTASNVLTQSPDGTELWQDYHGTNCLDGCPAHNGLTWPFRSDRAQPAFWSATGALVLGYPVDIADSDGHGRAVPIPVPSRNGGGQQKLPAWGDAFGDAAEGDAKAGAATGNWIAVSPTAVSLARPDQDRLDRIFALANPNLQTYTLYSRLKLTGPAARVTRYGLIAAYVDQRNYFLALIAPQGCNGAPCLTTEVVQAGVPLPPLACPLPASFDASRPTTLAIEAAYGTLTILVNDTLLSGPCQSRTVHLDEGQNPANGSNGQTGVAAKAAALEVSSFTVSYGVPQDSKQTSSLYVFRNALTHADLASSTTAQRSNSLATAAPAAPYPLIMAPEQLWKLQQRDGVFTIALIKTNLCLDAAAVDGAPPQLDARRCSESPTQHWALIPIAAPGGFLIESLSTGLVLDAVTSGQSSLVGLSKRTDVPSQIWQLLTP